MISERMKPLVNNNSAIRMMFEEGKRLTAIYGKENVFDFSLGNPSIPAPIEVNKAIHKVIDEESTFLLHGYMNNAGFEDVRHAVADFVNEQHGTDFDENNIIMTVGAAGALNVILKTIINPNDEVITFAPYFLEYNTYVKNYDGILKAISPDTKTFQPNLEEFEKSITKNTKAIIINSPNNPTGVVYSEDTIKAISKILHNKQIEYNSKIVIIADEPYRELAYDNVFVPYIPNYYDNTIVCYSYSKSLSLPGDRIGYMVIPNKLYENDKVFTAAAIANRTLGFVNAPSLIQRVLKHTLRNTSDIYSYDKNRKKLYEELTSYGFECVKPEGAFYLFMKSPIADEKVFCESAKKYNILMVSGSSFECAGFVRIAYCVAYETIERALPMFKKLADEYGLQGCDSK